jgi:hypothetical protein
MGTYVYSLKKQKRKIKLSEHVDSHVQHFSYAYKESFAWEPSRAYKMMVGRVDSQSQKAYEEYNENDLIVICDYKDEDGKITDLDGKKVYRKLASNTLYDSTMHDYMEYVGILKKEGKSYVLNIGELRIGA